MKNTKRVEPYVKYYVWDMDRGARPNWCPPRWRHEHIDVRNDIIFRATGRYQFVAGWAWDAFLVYAKVKKLEWGKLGRFAHDQQDQSKG